MKIISKKKNIGFAFSFCVKTFLEHEKMSEGRFKTEIVFRKTESMFLNNFMLLLKFESFYNVHAHCMELYQ